MSGTSSTVATRRVLAVMGDEPTGVAYVRFRQPFAHLAPHGFELRTLGGALRLVGCGDTLRPAPDTLDDVDLVVFPQSIVEPVLDDGRRVEIVAPLCDDASRRGIPIVYSTDDRLAAIDRSNPQYAALCETRRTVETVLAHASAILVTTETLRGSFAATGLPVHVLPNCIDPAHWTPRADRATPPRVGWAGSSSHLDDVALLLPAIERLQRRMEAPLWLLGLVDLPLAEQRAAIERDRDRFDAHQRETAARYREVADRLAGLDHVHRPFVAMPDYPAALADLDLSVGLCPLRDTPFNRHRSCVKFYEYAAVGTMTLASDVVPYRDEPVPVVGDDPDAWCDALERLLRDPASRTATLEAQRAWVFENRNIETWSARWADTLRQILGETDA